MADLLIILILLVIAAYFWQLRQMAELSRHFVEKACRKQNVQLLTIALASARPSLGGHTGLGWKAQYLFEFSTDGINQYQGNITIRGKTINKIEWPIFPEPEWLQAPSSQGSVGCGGCSHPKHDHNQ